MWLPAGVKTNYQRFGLEIQLLSPSTCVSKMWNISAPLPASRLGILMTTVEPGSRLGPLFITWNTSRKKRYEETQEARYIQTIVRADGCRRYLESDIERLEAALHVFKLDEARGVNGVSIHKGARCHHTAEHRGSHV